MCGLFNLFLVLQNGLLISVFIGFREEEEAVLGGVRLCGVKGLGSRTVHSPYSVSLLLRKLLVSWLRDDTSHYLVNPLNNLLMHTLPT